MHRWFKLKYISSSENMYPDKTINLFLKNFVFQRYICDSSDGRQWLEHLLRALNSNIQYNKNSDAIICTLRHVTNGHELDELARQAVSF